MSLCTIMRVAVWFAELNSLQTLEKEARIVILMLSIRKLELFEKCFDPVSECTTPTELKSSLHSVKFFFW